MTREIDIKANIKQFVRHGKEAESDEASAQAHRWEQARLAAEAVDDAGWTRQEYAEAVGLSKQTIGRYVKAWQRWGRVPLVEPRPRFADAIATLASGSDELVTMSERNKRNWERKEPTRHDDRVEMFAKLAADPKVVKEAVPRMLSKPAPARSEQGQAQRHIKQAVSQANARDRAQQLDEAKRKANATAAPLPAFMARVVLKLNELAATLAQLRGDFAELPDGHNRDLVVDALKQLDEQVARVLVEMDETPPELGEDIIEGTVVD